jgi:hypothetical protein
MRTPSVLSIFFCLAAALVFSVVWSVIGVLIISSTRDIKNADGWNCQKFYNRDGVHAFLGSDDVAGALNGKCTVAFDQHCHTKESDDGWMTPEELVIWHRMMGYDAFSITDHNKIYMCAEVREAASAMFPRSMVVFCGVEWTTHKFHMNILFPPNSSVPEVFDRLPYGDVTMPYVMDIVGLAHSIGAVVVLNHPTLTTQLYENPFPATDMIAAGVDYIEALTWDGVDDAALSILMQSNGTVGIIAGSDIHVPFLNTVSFTIMGVTALTEENVFAELKAKRTLVSQFPRP